MDSYDSQKPGSDGPYSDDDDDDDSDSVVDENAGFERLGVVDPDLPHVHENIVRPPNNNSRLPTIDEEDEDEDTSSVDGSEDSEAEFFSCGGSMRPSENGMIASRREEDSEATPHGAGQPNEQPATIDSAPMEEEPASDPSVPNYGEADLTSQQHRRLPLGDYSGRRRISGDDGGSDGDNGDELRVNCNDREEDSSSFDSIGYKLMHGGSQADDSGSCMEDNDDAPLLGPDYGEEDSSHSDDTIDDSAIGDEGGSQFDDMSSSTDDLSSAPVPEEDGNNTFTGSMRAETDANGAASVSGNSSGPSGLAARPSAEADPVPGQAAGNSTAVAPPEASEDSEAFVSFDPNIIAGGCGPDDSEHGSLHVPCAGSTTPRAATPADAGDDLSVGSYGTASEQRSVYFSCDSNSAPTFNGLGDASPTSGSTIGDGPDSAESQAGTPVINDNSAADDTDSTASDTDNTPGPSASPIPVITLTDANGVSSPAVPAGAGPVPGNAATGSIAAGSTVQPGPSAAPAAPRARTVVPSASTSRAIRRGVIKADRGKLKRLGKSRAGFGRRPARRTRAASNLDCTMPGGGDAGNPPPGRGGECDSVDSLGLEGLFGGQSSDAGGHASSSHSSSSVSEEANLTSDSEDSFGLAGLFDSQAGDSGAKTAPAINPNVPSGDILPLETTSPQPIIIETAEGRQEEKAHSADADKAGARDAVGFFLVCVIIILPIVIFVAYALVVGI